ncbi:CAP domain-containing protein [Mesorhizobium sp. 1B3]|uniref:CAP domain-containing protein n=1 Tax=Mesorhizobium sp. 1B3 TaxID=3243599 RepID=UPI003D9836AF
MPQHSANEQYLLELVNAERAKAKAQPLAFDNDLSEAAGGHSRWMLATDTFSHTGSDGSNSTERMKAAGYGFSGSWATGENIAWATTRAPTGHQDEVMLLHTNLMNSSGHRANLLNPNFREIGLGFEVGDYRGRPSAFATEDFAKSGSDLFLTGVAFDDRDGDRFYDPGEGLKDITVTASNSAGTFKTATMDAGGYDLALEPGTYTVTFSGPDIATSSQTVTISTQNIKQDLVDPVPKASAAAKAAQETAQEAVPGTAPDATSGSEPAPIANAIPESDGPSAATAAWLARFLGHDNGGDASNDHLPSFEQAEAAGPTAPDGGPLRFKWSGEAPSDAEELSDLAGHGGFDPNDDASTMPDDGILDDASWDIPAVDAALAKILAQAAHTATFHSDQLI